jgi:hypothetical protein
MKCLLPLLGLFVYSIHATTADDLRHAIIDSNVQQVIQLLPSFSEQDKNSFIPLAQEILTKRAKDYETYRMIPQFTFPVVATFGAGIATYLHCHSKSFTLNTILLEIQKIGLSCLQELDKNQILKEKIVRELNLNLPSDFVQTCAKQTAKDELKLGFSSIINKIGILTGIGLVATSVWLLFQNQQHIHDAYMNALEIKYLLTTSQNAATDTQDNVVRA